MKNKQRRIVTLTAKAKDYCNKAYNAGLTEKQLKYVESVWRMLAGEITAEEWLHKLRHISDDAVRIKVGCVIWWDFFGARDDNSGECLKVFNEMYRNIEINTPDVIEAIDMGKVKHWLARIALPERIAKERLEARYYEGA